MSVEYVMIDPQHFGLPRCVKRSKSGGVQAQVRKHAAHRKSGPAGRGFSLTLTFMLSLLDLLLGSDRFRSARHFADKLFDSNPGRFDGACRYASLNHRRVSGIRCGHTSKVY